MRKKESKFEFYHPRNSFASMNSQSFPNSFFESQELEELSDSELKNDWEKELIATKSLMYGTSNDWKKKCFYISKCEESNSND